ncbi:hypothetical protein BS78_10G240100 [Paspalum vaginatum]|nr:hypothetical protein BS78_10G240100 [Paspalum vaginatum]
MAKSAAAAVLLAVATVLGLVSASLADQGTATYYTVSFVRSLLTITISAYALACMNNRRRAAGSRTIEGTMIAAASGSLWDPMGRRRGVRGSHTVTDLRRGHQRHPEPLQRRHRRRQCLVDRCPSPGCQLATLDLSQEAFSAIGNIDAGKVVIIFQKERKPQLAQTNSCFLSF